jgi:hypothetical protein
MNVEINIHTDDYPSETTWTLTDQCGMGISIRGGWSILYPMEPRSLVSVNKNIPLGKYTFTIFDSAGDGICSVESYCGSYEILADGVTKLTGGVFEINDANTFGNCVVSSTNEDYPNLHVITHSFLGFICYCLLSHNHISFLTPQTTKPTSQPINSKPTTSKPTTRKPTTSKPTAHKPTTSKPTTRKPTTSKPMTFMPTTPGPTTRKPTTFKPTKRALTSKPTTFKPTMRTTR